MSSKCGDMEQALIDNAKAAYNSANIGRKNPKLQQRRKKGNMEEYTKEFLGSILYAPSVHIPADVTLERGRRKVVHRKR